MSRTNFNAQKLASFLLIISTIINFLFPLFITLVSAQSTTLSALPGTYEPGEVIVKYKEDKVDINSSNASAELKINSIDTGLKTKDVFEETNTIVYESDKKSTAQLISELEANPNVEYAEPNYIAKIFESASLDTDEPADPSDTSFDDQWALDNDGQESGYVGADIRAKQAWELTEATGSGTEMLVSIIDTGIDYTHTDLRENLWFNIDELPSADNDLNGEVTYTEVIADLTALGSCDGVSGITLNDLFCSSLENSVDDGGNGYIDDFIGWNTFANTNNPLDDHTGTHGTHVAGILAAVKENALGIAGVNTEIKIVAIKAFDSTGSANLTDISQAIDYSDAQAIKIINNSYGFTTTQSDPGTFLKTAIEDSGLNNGTLFVVASGNGRFLGTGHPDNTTSGYDIDAHASYTTYPAAYDSANIITIASNDRSDELSSFSNYGETSVDIFAPGDEIYSTLGSSLYGFKSGTSMATPMTTGVASLLHMYTQYLIDTNPSYATTTLNYSYLKNALIERSESIPELEGYTIADTTNELSGKRLNAYNVLPPDITYSFSASGTGSALTNNTPIVFTLDSNKPGKLSIADDPEEYNDSHSVNITENGTYTVEFEDEAGNIVEIEYDISRFLYTNIDNSHFSAVYSGNQNSFNVAGGCYGEANVNLSVNETVDNISTSPATVYAIPCINGQWTTNINLSSLDSGGNLTFTPTQSGTTSIPKNIPKIINLPEDPVITSPSDGSSTSSSTVSVVGTAEAEATITITGGNSEVSGTADDDGDFSISVSLKSLRKNRLIVSAVSSLGVPSTNTDTVYITNIASSSGGGGGGGGGGSSSPTPTPTVSVEFPDIAGNTFETYIENLAEAGVVSGYSDGTFKPDDYVTREQMAKFIVGAFDIDTTSVPVSSFTDVSTDSKFVLYISALKQLNIVSGYSDGTYRPTNVINRGEVTKFVALSLVNAGINISGQLENRFPDVSSDNIFGYYINYLAQNTVNNEPIISGFSDGTYKPEQPLTRGQMSKIIWNSMEFTEANTQ